MRRTILLAGAFALAWPAAAAAGPIELGAGTAPDVVTDPTGNAHIVWAGAERRSVEYCRLPRRGRSCAVRAALPVAEGGLGHPRILRRPAWNPCFTGFGCVAYARTRARRWEGKRTLYSLTGTAVEYVAVDAFADGGAVVVTGTEADDGPVRAARVPTPRRRR